jgi:ketosteroid isomerase-like protein
LVQSCRKNSGKGGVSGGRWTGGTGLVVFFAKALDAVTQTTASSIIFIELRNIAPPATNHSEKRVLRLLLSAVHGQQRFIGKENMMKYLSLIIVAALLSAGCEPKKMAVSAAPDAAKTRQVLDHHWDSFKGNDLEGVMADYTEDSILVTPGRTYKGLQEIRDNFVSAFSAYPKDATTFQLNKSVVERDIGYIIWEAKAPKINLTYGSDTFVIRDGKIVSQTYAGVATPVQ